MLVSVLRSSALQVSSVLSREGPCQRRFPRSLPASAQCAGARAACDRVRRHRERKESPPTGPAWPPRKADSHFDSQVGGQTVRHQKALYQSHVRVSGPDFCRKTILTPGGIFMDGLSHESVKYSSRTREGTALVSRRMRKSNTWCFSEGFGRTESFTLSTMR
jgi:hypothetical protein